MALVLGIDAAWTEAGSSGVALLQIAHGALRVLTCAPSYASFVGYAQGKPIDWCRPLNGPLNAAELLAAATEIGKAPIDIVAIDMPISRVSFARRRSADQEISRAFGAAWAGTHSPTALRPGPYGHRITRDLISAGFCLAVREGDSAAPPALIEVYPLAALVRLMNLPRRPPYKVARNARYWRGAQAAERIDNLLQVWSAIFATLQQAMVELSFNIPERCNVPRLSALKPYEDGLDALISAYVGALFLQGKTEAFGDADAAIWVPKIGQSTGATSDYLAAIQHLLPEWDNLSDRIAFRDL